MKQLVFVAFTLCSLFAPTILSSQTFDTLGLANRLDSLYDFTKNIKGKGQIGLMDTTLTELYSHFPDHLKGTAYYARIKNISSYLFYKKKNYTNTIEFGSEAMKLYEKLGKSCNIEIFNIKQRNASCFLRIGKLAKADSLLKNALQCNEQYFGKNHYSATKIPNLLGVIAFRKGELTEAEHYFEGYKKMALLHYGETSMRYAESLMNAGNVQMMQSKYEDGALNYAACIEVLEKSGKTDSKQYGMVMGNLGTAYTFSKQYKKREKLLLKSLNILPKGSEEYANNLSNLGNFYKNIGNDEKALKCYRDAIGIYDKTNLGYFGSMVESSNILMKNKTTIKEAEQILNDVILSFKDIYKESKHKFYWKALFALNSVHIDTKKYDLAFKELKEIEEEVSRLEVETDFSPTFAKHYAYLFYKTGNFEKADSILTFLSASKSEHKDVLTTENSNFKLLVLVKYALKDLEGVNRSFEEWSNQDRKRLSKTANFLSELELTEYLASKSSDLNEILSATFSSYKDIENYTTILYNELISLKSYALASSILLKKKIQEDSSSIADYKRLLVNNHVLNKLYLNKNKNSEKIDSFELVSQLLEKKLSNSLSEFNQSEMNIEWKNIQLALKQHEVAVEFYQYQNNDQTQYFALILNTLAKEPRLVELFKASELKKLLQKYKKRKGSYANNLYQWNPNESGLYDMIWKPLQPFFNDATTIYYAPSGLLNQLNLNAIPTDKQNIASDEKTLIRLNSTRELLQSAVSKIDNSMAMLYGGIYYELDSTTTRNTNSDHRGLNTEHPLLGFRDAMANTQSTGDDWGYLPSSKEELSAIKQSLEKAKLDVQTYEGFSATEESFKAQDGNSPRILHLATHAYFFPDSKKSKLSLTQESAFNCSDHPLIRSGLIMTGANHAWKTGKALKPDMEDGILTAYEISQLDLSQTELVVLSACETGLGDIKGNEGVYGLQRAFKMAGAQHIIMSLWQVPDYHTKDLMERFYKNWLQEGLTINTALVKAQNSLRAEGLTPYFWAGFTVLD